MLNNTILTFIIFCNYAEQPLILYKIITIAFPLFSMVILDGVLDGSSIPWPSDVPRGRMQRWQKVTNVHITAVSLYLISLEVLLAEQ
jgi:hypothetical protein